MVPLFLVFFFIYYILFIHFAVDIWVACTSWLSWIMLWACSCLFQTLLSILLDIYVEVGLLDHMAVLIFEELLYCFHRRFIILQSHQNFTSFPNSSRPYHQSFLFSVLTVVTLMGIWWHLIVLICISLLISDVEHLFMCLFVFCISSMEKCLFKSLAHFLLNLFLLLLKL